MSPAPFSVRRAMLRASVAILPLVLVACSGGGGGGGGGPVVTQPVNTSPSTDKSSSPPLPSSDPARAAYETQEYFNNGVNAPLNASGAYARGHFGTGVTVGVVDGRIDPTHPELEGRVLSVRDYTGSATADARHAHAVTGVIAAARNGRGVHGVAPEANIRNYAIINNDGTIPADGRAADALLQASRDGVKIVNNSYGAAGGSVSSQDEDAMRQLVNDGAVLVWAAGNDGAYTPSRESVLPTRRADLEKGWLVVASVDENNKLSSFSNACGVAKDWCVVAPGNQVGSIGVTQGTTVRATGTSFSAPAASGALAVLMDAFPSLTAQQARDILLETATSLGDSNIYGRGLIDLERATRPVGALSVAGGDSVDGAGFAMAGTGLRSGGAMGDGVAQALQSAPVMVLDSYQRPYMAALPGAAAEDRFSAIDGLASFGQERPVLAPAGPGMAAGFTTDADGAWASSRVTASLGSIAVDAEMGALNVETASLAAMSGQGVRARPDVVGHPYLGLVDEGAQVSAGMGDMGVTMLGSPDGDRMGAAVLLRPWSGHDVRLALGAVSEQGAALGATGFGALALDGTTTTGFASLALRQPLSGAWSMAAGVHAGVTRLSGQGESLVRGFDAVSSAAAVSLERAETFAPGGVLSFTVAQPLRVENGAFHLDRPVSRTVDGAVMRQASRLGATPSGREVNLELGWSGPAFADGTGRLAASVLHRLQPGHVADAPSETVVMGRFNLRF